MGEGLLLLVFKRRHTIQYFQATDQINSIQGSSIHPFSLKFGFSKNAYTCTLVLNNGMFIYCLRWEAYFCFEKALYLAKLMDIHCSGHHWSHMILFNWTSVHGILKSSECQNYRSTVNKKYQFLRVKRANILMKSPCTFPYFWYVWMCISYFINCFEKYQHLVFWCMINTFVYCYHGRLCVLAT